MTPPALLASIQPTICVNPSTSRVASKILYLNDRESDTPSPSFFDPPRIIPPTVNYAHVNDLVMTLSSDHDTMPSHDSMPSLEHSHNSMPSLEISPPPALVTLLTPQHDSQMPTPPVDDNDDQNSLSDISDSVFGDDDDDDGDDRYTHMD